MVFLPTDASLREKCEKALESIVREEGQTLLGWRTVPTNNSTLGDSARSAEPFVRQIFIGQSSDIRDQLAFERKLYVIRKLAEKAVLELEGAGQFYFASLSSRTIVYKGMLTPEQVDGYYVELKDPRLETAIAWCIRVLARIRSRAGSVPTRTAI